MKYGKLIPCERKRKHFENFTQMQNKNCDRSYSKMKVSLFGSFKQERNPQ